MDFRYAKGYYAIAGQYYLNTITRNNNQPSFTCSVAYVTIETRMQVKF
ncbi:MAG: hypothetical protein MR860_01900 [Prevotella sp.]|nr:hypothetical protein [Prevotella sp.]